ncbi:dihydroorotase [Curtanaerobium respiraculi]|uniref:dihydroorotase n=1 Tax=Curtanaerobium respiraculi TaxID=2949669 RepID=UPI0024B32BCF|nr:dihydroorotase [Curtanaerobium respiraculi]
MTLLLKGARAIDPQAGLDDIVDVLVEDGKIAEVGKGLSRPGCRELDLAGKILVPGLVDIHVHLRDPGQEQKETIETGTRAAAHGGFTAVCCMPNTAPTIDTAFAVEYVRGTAERVGKCRVHVAGSCTTGLAGEILSDMGDMARHGAVAFTDDGRGVQGAGMMRRVMDYAHQFGKVIMSHCQDEDLVGDGVVNEGECSTRLGLLGWPAAGEEIQIARDIALCRLTGTPLHVQHITTARGVQLVRDAKAEGLPVTAEATPHHLFLTDEIIDDTYNANYKVNPPLRTEEDRAAVTAGILDGTIDCIVTDHAPHCPWEKDCEFELAKFGMTGLETSLGLVLTQLVGTGVMGYARMVELMAVNPRRIIQVEPVRIAAGSTADITVFDPAVEWTVDADDFESKSKNSGFIGAHLKGRATDVLVGGEPTMLDGKVLG